MSDTAAKSPLAPPAVARTNTTPPGWANDELTKFLQEIHQLQYATFHNKKEAVGQLMAIDELFVRVSENWMNPPSEVEAMLFVRCHAAFRAAAGEAMAGQAVECYRQCRGMLEIAAYAVHIHRDPSLAKVWLNRHQDEAGMGASKKAFQHTTVAASVATANQHAGMRFKELYQRKIDWGAHPNERSVTGNMKMIEEPDRRVMLAILLHGDGVELDMALKTEVRDGVARNAANPLQREVRTARDQRCDAQSPEGALIVDTMQGCGRDFWSYRFLGHIKSRRRGGGQARLPPDKGGGGVSKSLAVSGSR